MLTNSRALRSYHAYLCCAARTASTLITPLAGGHAPRAFGSRVLVVEFRDEVYASLKSLLEHFALNVERAETGETVAHRIHRFDPGLVLINQDMPDESGWLIACKLRLSRVGQPVWLYAARSPRCHVHWKEFAGVDELIVYGGVLFRLLLEIRQRITPWLAANENRPVWPPVESVAPALLAQPA